MGSWVVNSRAGKQTVTFVAGRNEERMPRHLVPIREQHQPPGGDGLDGSGRDIHGTVDLGFLLMVGKRIRGLLSQA